MPKTNQLGQIEYIKCIGIIMKVTDFMVGDWAYVADYPMMRMPKQIECGHFVRSHCSFEGIPINELFLEKNGFVYDQKEQAFCFNKNQVIIQKCSDEKNGVSLWRFVINSEMTIMDINIKYIHELQHAIKFSNIAKTIVL